MTDSELNDRKRYLLYSIVLFLPFVVFYRLIPFLSGYTIGNDYLLYSIRWQMELLFSIKSGSFPLYVPGFASGHSSSALTMGQVFHPLSHLTSIMPGYWDGKAIDWNNLFKLLSLGLAHLVLFAFLQRLKVRTVFSFILSFITVYNLKTLELYRHGASLEAYSGYLIVCAFIGMYFIRPARWTGPLCIIGGSYLLICSGHPEEMYYGLLCVVLFLGISPFFISTMLSEIKVNLKTACRFWIRTGFFLFIGILLSAAYILPFYFEFINDNVTRVGQGYDFANEHIDTFIGTINNFFLPLRSYVYEAFGGASLILIAFILPVIGLFKVRIPFSIWSIWGLMMVIFLHIQGSRTPVHRLAWEYLPFASSIRDPGRISMILPFFIMMILAWVVVQAKTISLNFRRSVITLKPITILACLSMLLTTGYYILYLAAYYNLSSAVFNDLFKHPVGNLLPIPYLLIEFLIVVTGMFLLTCLAVYGMRADMHRTLGLLVVVFTCLQVGVVMNYRGTFWIQKNNGSPTFLEMQEQKKAKLDYLYYEGGGMHSSVVLSHLERAFVEPFLGKIYTHIVPVTSREDAYIKMERDRLPQQLFIEKYDSEKAQKITEGAKDMEDGFVKLEYSSFNRINLRVVAERPALLGISYPYTGKWRAWINGERVDIYRANGAAQAVEIPGGENIVEFRYRSSAALWGMLISCIVFVLVGSFVCFRTLIGPLKFIGIIVIAALGAGGFILWYNSLYSGDNLKTEYIWFYSPPMKISNLAYGKNTWVIPAHEVCNACEPDYSHTRLVDGDFSLGSGFAGPIGDNPMLIIDLHRQENIETIVLYESGRNSKENRIWKSHPSYPFQSEQGAPVNVRPLSVALSDDNINWLIVASLASQPDSNIPSLIIFDRPQTARYIMITAAGKGILSFDEVEVYGPH